MRLAATVLCGSCGFDGDSADRRRPGPVSPRVTRQRAVENRKFADEDRWVAFLKAAELSDVVRLSPPGFGAPPPRGWRATPEAYQLWLTEELESLGTAVDLVGHDWGGAHAMNVVMTRPDLIRSWCVDSLGLFEPDYVWHGLARTWQTPGSGERAAAALTDPAVERRALYLTSIGVPDDIAGALAPGCGEVSGRCMLELYRSAREPKLAELGRALPSAARRPGLAILATADQGLGIDALRRRAAAGAGAIVEVLPGLGHWWMLEDPTRSGRRLQRFWSDVARPSQPVTPK